MSEFVWAATVILSFAYGAVIGDGIGWQRGWKKRGEYEDMYK